MISFDGEIDSIQGQSQLSGYPLGGEILPWSTVERQCPHLSHGHRPTRNNCRGVSPAAKLAQRLKPGFVCFCCHPNAAADRYYPAVMYKCHARLYVFYFRGKAFETGKRMIAHMFSGDAYHLDGRRRLNWNTITGSRRVMSALEKLHIRPEMFGLRLEISHNRLVLDQFFQ